MIHVFALSVNSCNFCPSAILYKKYNALLKKGEKHSIEKVGERLRSMMPWMQKRSIKGAQAAY